MEDPGRAKQRANAQAFVSIRNSKGGRVLKKIMADREQKLREAHYLAEGTMDLGSVGENKGAYTELMYWRSMLFEMNIATEEDSG